MAMPFTAGRVGGGAGTPPARPPPTAPPGALGGPDRGPPPRGGRVVRHPAGQPRRHRPAGDAGRPEPGTALVRDAAEALQHDQAGERVVGVGPPAELLAGELDVVGGRFAAAERELEPVLPARG